MALLELAAYACFKNAIYRAVIIQTGKDSNHPTLQYGHRK